MLIRILPLAALLASSAFGGVIWTQALNQSGDNYDLTSFVQASDFTLTGAANITDVRIWMADRSETGSLDGVAENYSGILGWAIYSDNAGAPGSLLYSGTDSATTVTPTGLLSGTDREIFLVDAHLTGLPSFAAGTYWLALREGAWGSASDGSSVAWMQGALQGASRYNSSNLTNPSFVNVAEQDNAFALYDNSGVPEPSSLILIGAGLFGLALARFRSR